jgi:hypothetical protein
MNLVLMTQYFDTLKEIGATSRSNTILIPHTPGNLNELSTQMRDAMISADLVTHEARLRSHDEKPTEAGESNGSGKRFERNG